MIKFEFILDDVEAEDLIDCIQNEIVSCHDQIQDCILYGTDSTPYKTRINYLERLRHKIASSSKRV